MPGLWSSLATNPLNLSCRKYNKHNVGSLFENDQDGKGVTPVMPRKGTQRLSSSPGSVRFACAGGIAFRPSRNSMSKSLASLAEAAPLLDSI